MGNIWPQKKCFSGLCVDVLPGREAGPEPCELLLAHSGFKAQKRSGLTLHAGGHGGGWEELFCLASVLPDAPLPPHACTRTPHTHTHGLLSFFITIFWTRHLTDGCSPTRGLTIRVQLRSARRKLLWASLRAKRGTE